MRALPPPPLAGARGGPLRAVTGGMIVTVTSPVERLQAVRDRIAAAARAVGRDPA